MNFEYTAIKNLILFCLWLQLAFVISNTVMVIIAITIAAVHAIIFLINDWKVNE